MLRFAKEIHEIGVTDDMKKTIESQLDRMPNAISCGTDEDVRKFYYRYGGYMIEAVQNVKIVVKKCNT